MEDAHHIPITLPVADLRSSFSFYLSALKPLGYQHITASKDQVRQLKSQQLGLGPVNTDRIDIVLSPSQNVPNSRDSGNASHLIFPAASSIAVREFYTAALNAGGRIVSRPTKIDNGAEFSATVGDFDGNEIEVGYTDPAIRASPFPKGSETTTRPTSNSIQRWTETVANHNPTRDIQALPPNGGPVDPIPTQAASQTRDRRASISSSKKSNSGSKGSGSVTGKNLVGTLLGAAAGAAVVYALAQELDDSKAKEAKFNARMEARRRVKAEAKARAIAAEWREKTRNSRRRRNSLADRDSGYYSRRSPSPEVTRYRTITYQPVPDPRRDNQSRTSSRTATRTVQPVSPPQRSQSSKAGISRASSHKENRSRTSSRTANRVDELAQPPQNPQSSKTGLGRSSSLRERPLTHVTVSSPPSRPPRPPLSRDQAAPLPDRSSTSNSRSASRRASKSLDEEISARPPSRDQRRSPPTSTRTIRYVPVTSPSREQSQTTKSRRQSEDSQLPPVPEGMPPPDDPNRAGHMRPAHEYIDQLDLDDETVVPDDSISCVSTDVGPQHRAKSSRRGGGSLKSKGRVRRKMGIAY